MSDSRPTVLIFHVDNLGYGELGCYGGGILRGVDTKRIDELAAGASDGLAGPRSDGRSWL